MTLLFALLSVSNLFHAGLPPTHDGEYHVVRFYEFDKALRDGNLYPFWAQDLNYTFGSPLFNYVYPLPNYVASALHLLGVSFIDAFKGNLILASLVGAVGAYLFGRNRFKEWGGLLTSVFYTFAPYHSLDVYIRGSVGEVWALAFFPLSLWSLDRVSKKSSISNIIYAGIFFALTIFAHNILAVMFVFFALTYIVLLTFQSRKKMKTFLSLIMGFLLGVLLTSIFFIPALAEQKYVNGLKIFDVFSNFPEAYQLIIPSWGSGYSCIFSGTEMSFQLGIANLLIIILVLIAIVLKRAKKDKVFLFFYLAWFLVLCFLITPYSIPIWKMISPMQYFQFPWRFISLAILCCAILAGYTTLLYGSKILYVFLLVFLISTTFNYAKAPYFMDRRDSYYLTHENFIYGSNSIADVFQTVWLSKQTKLPKQRAYLSTGNGTVKFLKGTSTSQTYLVNLGAPGEIIINTAYFPGWKAYDGRKEIGIGERRGKIAVSVESGKHNLEIKLIDTQVRLLSKIVSFLALLILLIIFFKGSVIQYFHEGRN